LSGIELMEEGVGNGKFMNPRREQCAHGDVMDAGDASVARCPAARYRASKRRPAPFRIAGRDFRAHPIAQARSKAAVVWGRTVPIGMKSPFTTDVPRAETREARSK